MEWTRAYARAVTTSCSSRFASARSWRRTASYQVPHCNGGGYRDPSAVAEMRRTKAEGGWGVIFTEQTEIHQTSEITPSRAASLGRPRHPGARTDGGAMKSHGALAGIQLAYSGINGPNLYSREVPLAVTGGPILTFTADRSRPAPSIVKTSATSGAGSKRRAPRARTAGFDLVCLYGAHASASSSTSCRGRPTSARRIRGSLENRSRFVREVVAEAREEMQGEMAITLRLSLHEAGALGFSNAESATHRHERRLTGPLGPRAWNLENCSGTSRFVEEARRRISFAASATDLQAGVGVGRFTRPTPWCGR